MAGSGSSIRLQEGNEVLNRRIGRNELAIIEVCGAVADAQGKYLSQAHDGEHTKQFAAKFIRPGKAERLVLEGCGRAAPEPARVAGGVRNL
jgi:hypothetical protein